ncbi:GFA family protein [Leptolyngbya cf. ectocarpi LEGE 11479]|uniref:GFA family protein n=1 Tax=Leptolyngbya cf. ectocarpi LEGE 11479 TaxID=1828722 RepID=A0A928ZTY5_LEPEC|nr:GFA family protein [Leptolyngbya ectocarpi]MBE9067393.1 GFA family protein [Leptolyngbya cf. ectocarpi LEGE 11479]
MTEPADKNGSCLCGAVSFTTSNFSKKVGACHCDMCRKWGGGPFMEVDCGTGIAFKGEENITVYDSSDWAERGFCNKCGSHLFYRLKGSNQHMVPVGLFDDQAPFVFDSQVFIDKKPSFYSFANQTNNMTAAEIFEMYGLS